MGYVLCVILIALCILLVIAAAVFGSKKTVDIFGVNIYIVDTDDIESAPRGGAVLVQKGSAAELEAGKLVLYLKSDENDEPTLGYVQDISARDGVHYITVVYKNTLYEFIEAKLVGRADYYSKFLGGVIGFIKTPLGIMLIAVLPCAALILYDIIRTAAANRPEPEVIPKVKNADEEHPHTDIKLSVDTEGKALYSKDRSLKTLPKDNSVLFNYSGKQNAIKKEPSVSERPIIPLTDKKTKTAPATTASEKTGKRFDIKLPSDTADTETSAKMSAVLKPDVSAAKSEPKTSADTISERYSHAADDTPSERTTELPPVNKKPSSGDAFFAQSSAGKQGAPQIGRQRRQTLPSENDPASRQAYPRPEKTAGKRSTQILASKNFNDLLSDDDDPAYSRGSNDKSVDDILASINNRK